MSQHIWQCLAAPHVVAVSGWTCHVNIELVASTIKPVLFILGSKTTEILQKLSNPSKRIVKLSMSLATTEDPGYNVHQHLMFVIVCHVAWSQNWMEVSSSFLPQSFVSIKPFCSFLKPLLNAKWSSPGKVSGVRNRLSGISSDLLRAYPADVSLLLTSSSFVESCCSWPRLLDCAWVLDCAAEVLFHRLELDMVKKQCGLRDSTSWAAGANSKNSQESLRVSPNRNTSCLKFLKSTWLQTVGNHDLR